MQPPRAMGDPGPRRRSFPGGLVLGASMVALFAVLLATSVPSRAGRGPEAEPRIRVRPESGPVGTEVSVSGRGCAGEGRAAPVVATLTRAGDEEPLGTFRMGRVEGSGTFTVAASVPRKVAGMGRIRPGDRIAVSAGRCRRVHGRAPDRIRLRLRLRILTDPPRGAAGPGLGLGPRG
ncbi:MAG: hypothetical protein HY658_10735 [Actinobacteria bacterium]|nr:hypothetical protein [Actinomycetota bacterium]